jgi:hypothetical protein
MTYIDIYFFDDELMLTKFEISAKNILRICDLCQYIFFDDELMLTKFEISAKNILRICDRCQYH